MMPSSMEVTTYGGHRLDTGRDESVEFMWSESKLGPARQPGRGNQQIIIMATLLRVEQWRVQLLSQLLECSDTMGWMVTQ